MRRLTSAVLACVAGLLLALPMTAGREVTLLSAVSAASGSATTVRTAGYTIVRVQVCGASSADGAVAIKQGATAASIVTVKTVTLTNESACSVDGYIALKAAAFTGASYTRSNGTISAYLELAP